MKWAYSISILSMLMLAGCSEKEEIDMNDIPDHNIKIAEDDSWEAKEREMKYDGKDEVEEEPGVDVEYEGNKEEDNKE